MKTLSSPAVRLARGVRCGFAILGSWLLLGLREIIPEGGLSSNLSGFLRAQETGPSHGLPDAPHQEPVPGNQRDGDGDRGEHPVHPGKKVISLDWLAGVILCQPIERLRSPWARAMRGVVEER